MNGWRLENCFLSLCECLNGTWECLNFLEPTSRLKLQKKRHSANILTKKLADGHNRWDSAGFSLNCWDLLGDQLTPKLTPKLGRIRGTQGLSIAPAAYIRMHLRPSGWDPTCLRWLYIPKKKMFQTTNQQHLPKCPNSVFGSFWGFMLGRSNSAGGFTCYPRQNSPVMSRPHLADKSPLRLHRLTHHLGKLHNFAFLFISMEL